jgi:hypothetical protein
VFLYLYCGSVVAKGTKTNWDGHNWGYIARTVPMDVTMLGIYGYMDRCGHYLIVVGSC